MGMKDRSLIDKINPIFIALTAMVINNYVLAWKTGEFRVPAEFSPGGGVQCKCHTRNINDAVNDACTDVFGSLDADHRSSSPQVQAGKIDNIRSMICQRIHSTGTVPAIVQPHNDQGSVDDDFLDYVLEELLEQPHHSFNRLSSFVTATEASLQFSAVLPAFTSSSQPVPCTNSNGNSDNMTNMTSVENTGVVDGSTIGQGSMSLGG